jgi:hypothetical protein
MILALSEWNDAHEDSCYAEATAFAEKLTECVWEVLSNSSNIAGLQLT